MSIRVRLIFTLSVLLGLMASQVIITVSLISRMADISNDISTNHLAQLEKINTVYTDLLLLEIRHPGQEPASYPKVTLEQLVSDVRTLEQQHTEPETNLSDFKYYYNEFLEEFKQPFETTADSVEVTSPARLNSYNNLLQQVDALREQSLAGITAYTSMSNVVAERTRYLLSAALLLVTVVEIVLGWHLARSISSGLNTLLAATRNVARGNLRQPVVWNSSDEFGHLARSFNAMLRSLQSTREENLQLHQETTRINVERIRLLRERLSQTVRAQEDERHRVARELHDQAGQALTALKLGLGHLQKQAGNEEFVKQVEELKNLTVSTMEDIRDISLDLRPSMLDDLGLIPTVRQYCKQFSRRSGIAVNMNIPEAISRQSGEVEITVFRVIQEALTNTAKHAKASEVTVTIEINSAELYVAVSDDGIGFNVEEALRKQGKESIGLFGIRERVELLDGTISIKSISGNGTLLEFYIPLLEMSLFSS